MADASVQPIAAVEPIPAQSVTTEPKKKSKAGIIILVIILIICAVVSAGGYLIYQKGKEVVEDGIETVTDVTDTITDTNEAFEQIQEEIRVVTQQGIDGELTPEEVEEKLRELNDRSLELLIESNE